MLTKRNFSSSPLKHYRCLASATGDIIGISEASGDIAHLYPLSLSERRSEKKTHSFYPVEETLERSFGKLASLWWLFSGDLVSQNAVFVWEMTDTNLEDIKKWNSGKLSSWIMSCFDSIRITVIAAAAHSCVSILKCNKIKYQASHLALHSVGINLIVLRRVVLKINVLLQLKHH